MLGHPLSIDYINVQFKDKFKKKLKKIPLTLQEKV